MGEGEQLVGVGEPLTMSIVRSYLGRENGGGSPFARAGIYGTHKEGRLGSVVVGVIVLRLKLGAYWLTGSIIPVALTKRRRQR
jgi:hypothetical protein